MRKHLDPGTAVLLGAYLMWKFWTLTFLYGAVFLWHQRRSPSLAEVSVNTRLKGELNITPQDMAQAQQDLRSQAWGQTYPRERMADITIRAALAADPILDVHHLCPSTHQHTSPTPRSPVIIGTTPENGKDRI